MISRGSLSVKSPHLTTGKLFPVVAHVLVAQALYFGELSFKVWLDLRKVDLGVHDLGHWFNLVSSLNLALKHFDHVHLSKILN